MPRNPHGSSGGPAKWTDAVRNHGFKKWYSMLGGRDYWLQQLYTSIIIPTHPKSYLASQLWQWCSWVTSIMASCATLAIARYSNEKMTLKQALFRRIFDSSGACQKLKPVKQIHLWPLQTWKAWIEEKKPFKTPVDEWLTVEVVVPIVIPLEKELTQFALTTAGLPPTPCCSRCRTDWQTMRTCWRRPRGHPSHRWANVAARSRAKPLQGSAK